MKIKKKYSNTPKSELSLLIITIGQLKENYLLLEYSSEVACNQNHMIFYIIKIRRVAKTSFLLGLNS